MLNGREETKTDSRADAYFPVQKPSNLISRSEKKRLSSQMDSLFKNRPSANEMYARGIMDWNRQDAETMGDYETFRHYKEDNLRDISARLNRRISHKFRPSKTDLELRGIVPRGAFEDSTHAAEDRDMQNSIRNITLTRHIAQRPRPDEIRGSKIFEPGDSGDIYGHEDSRDRMKRASMDLTWRFGQRARLEELVSRGIIAPEYAKTLMGSTEYSDAEAAAHRRSRIAKEKLEMRFSNRADAKHVLARGIVDEAYLYSDAGAVVMEKRRSKMEAQDALAGMLNKLKGLQQQAMDAASRADGNYEMEDLVVDESSLNPPNSKERFKRASVDLEWRVSDRQGLDEVIARGIVHPAFEDVIKGNKDYTSAQQEREGEAERIRSQVARQVHDRMYPEEAIARGVVAEGDFERDHDAVERAKKKKRRQLEKEMAGKVAGRPHKTALEERGITYPANIAPMPSPSPQPSRSPSKSPYGERNHTSDQDRSGARALAERLAEDADRLAYEDARGEYHRSNIPPSVNVSAGNGVNGGHVDLPTPTARPRIAKERSLNAFMSSRGRMRPNELEERGIVPSGYWQNPKNAVLQQHISRDQARINFEAAFRSRDQVSDLIARGYIRPEFVENFDNPSIAKQLVAGQRVQLSHALKQKLDPKVRLTPEEMQARGFVPYRVGEDPLVDQMSVIERIKHERDQTRNKLDQKLDAKRRPSFQALQARHIIPVHWYDVDEKNYTVADAEQYFSGRNASGQRVRVTNADHDQGRTSMSGPSAYGHGRKMSKATAFETMFDQLKKKPDLMEEMAKNLLMEQLVRAGHMDAEDISKLEERKTKKKAAIQNKLNRRLSRDFRPSPSELEKRNIVPTGYWNDMKKAFSKQHRRRKTAENELGNALANRLTPSAMVSRGYASEDFMKMVYNGNRDAPNMKSSHTSSSGNHDNGFGVRISRSASPIDRDHDLIEEEKVAASGAPSPQPQAQSHVQSHASLPLNPPPLPASSSVKMNRHLDGDWASAILNSPSTNPAVSATNMNPRLNDDSSELLFGDLGAMATPRGNLSLSNSSDRRAWSEFLSLDAWNEMRESLVNSLSFLSIYEAIMFGIRSRTEELDYLSDVIDNTDSNMRHTRSASQAATIRDAAALANEKQIRYEKEVEKLQILFGDVRRFEDNFLDKMNGLVQRKKVLLENEKTCVERYDKACEYMSRLSDSQSRLVDKINLNMRITLRKIRSMEDALVLNSNSESNKMESDLQFQKYMLCDYQNMLDEMSGTRRSVSEEIFDADSKRNVIATDLKSVCDEIAAYEIESWNVLDEFKACLPPIVGEEEATSAMHSKREETDQNRNRTPGALNIQIEHRDDVSDLEVAVKYRTDKIENDLKVLEKRTNHLNTLKYVRRISEIVQLQMILKSGNLRKFYELFVKHVNVAFTEISYAHTIFSKASDGNSLNEIWSVKKEGISSLETIQYIASMTPGDGGNQVSYEATLMDICGEMQSYICSLPDRDAVIYHVARHLTTHRIRRAEIEVIEMDSESGNNMEMVSLVNQRVHEWIRALLSTRFSSESESLRMVTGSATKNLVRSASVTSDSFGLIAASQRDILAQVRTSRAASIVLNRVYGIHLDI